MQCIVMLKVHHRLSMNVTKVDKYIKYLFKLPNVNTVKDWLSECLWIYCDTKNTYGFIEHWKPQAHQEKKKKTYYFCTPALQAFRFVEFLNDKTNQLSHPWGRLWPRISCTVRTVRKSTAHVEATCILSSERSLSSSSSIKNTMCLCCPSLCFQKSEVIIKSPIKRGDKDWC